MNFRNTHPYINGHAGPSARRPRPVTLPSDSCVAVLDDRFVSWLVHGDCEDGNEPVVDRRGLNRLVGRALTDAGLDIGVRRIYWYTDRPDADLIDGQLVRSLDTSNESRSIWDAMADDIRRLSERRACEHLLVASDDDRLIEVINEAQLNGIQVHLLVDEVVDDLSSLRNEDPTWAALLSQADRRIPLRAGGVSPAEFGPRPLQPFDQGRPVRTSEIARAGDALSNGERQIISEVVELWWEGQLEHERESLREAMEERPGIPQEVDRALLLRARERVVRPLSFNEKRLMRELVRERVFGERTQEETGAAA